MARLALALVLVLSLGVARAEPTAPPRDRSRALRVTGATLMIAGTAATIAGLVLYAVGEAGHVDSRCRQSGIVLNECPFGEYNDLMIAGTALFATLPLVPAGVATFVAGLRVQVAPDGSGAAARLAIRF